MSLKFGLHPPNLFVKENFSMKRSFLLFLILITSLLPLSPQSVHGATAAQVTLKVKKIYPGSPVKFITSSGSVWEYDSIQAHQVSGLNNIVALSEGANPNGTFALQSDGSVWYYDNHFNSRKLSAYKGITAVSQQYGTLYALDTKGNLHIGSSDNNDPSGDRIIQTKVKLMSANSNADLLLVVYSDGSVGKFEDYKWSKIKELKNIVSVYAGFMSSFALDSNGVVWAWGSNYDGNLGDGTTIDRPAPVKVQGLPKIISISDKKALAQDGTVWAWGSNDWGQLGDGSPATPAIYEKTSGWYKDQNLWNSPYNEVSSTPHSTPVQVKGLTNIIQIADSYALDKQGVLWGWGDNRSRDILNSDLTAITEPQQINLTINNSYPGTWSYKNNSKYSSGRYIIPLADGRIFVHGYNGSFLYNPLTSKIVSKEDFKLLESSTQIYPLSDGTILFKYGGAWDEKTLQIFNPDMFTSQTIANPPFVDVESVIPLSKERVLFLGTRKANENVYNHAMLYNIKIKKWTTLPDMGDHRVGPIAAELPDGRVVVAGGDTLARSDLEILNIEERTWTTYSTDLPELDDINMGTIKIIPLDSEHVVIVAGLRLYTFDITNHVIKKYSTPRSDNYLVSRLGGNQLLLLGESVAYSFDTTTGNYSAFKHPGRTLSIYDLLFTLPNGALMYFGYGGEFTLKTQ